MRNDFMSGRGSDNYDEPDENSVGGNGKMKNGIVMK